MQVRYIINQVGEKGILISTLNKCSITCRGTMYMPDIFEGQMIGHKVRGRPRKLFIE